MRAFFSKFCLHQFHPPISVCNLHLKNKQKNNRFHTKAQCPNTSTMSYTGQKDGLMVLEGKDSSVHWSQNSTSCGGGDARTPVPPTCYIPTRVGKMFMAPKRSLATSMKSGIIQHMPFGKLHVSCPIFQDITSSQSVKPYTFP